MMSNGSRTTQGTSVGTVIVGAGLAGLTCAKVLAESGCDFLLLEAADEPGGRVVSRRTPEGYVLDRGFQVLLDSYPAARRHLDWGGLGGGCFRSGALFVGAGRPQRLENPLFNPWSLFWAFRGRVVSWRDQWRLLRLVLLSLRSGEEALGGLAASARDLTAAELLRSRKLSGEFFRRFASPFFGGVLLDPELGTSGSLLLGYLSRFTTGRAWLPAGGIGAIPTQLASRLPSAALRCSTEVAGLVIVDEMVRGVRLQDGSVIEADRVVLATEEPATCRLLACGEPRAAHATAAHYFRAPVAWYSGAWLCLPPRDICNPVLHAAMVTNACPSLAPDGCHLWSVTVLPDHPLAGDPRAVASEVASWFGGDPEDLQHLDFVRVPYAVPVQPPGFAARPTPWGRLPGGVLVAGDAVCGASIEAAMASGEVAAKILIPSGSRN